jgi:hypothetical protein
MTARSRVKTSPRTSGRGSSLQTRSGRCRISSRGSCRPPARHFSSAWRNLQPRTDGGAGAGIRVTSLGEKSRPGWNGALAARPKWGERRSFGGIVGIDRGAHYDPGKGDDADSASRRPVPPTEIPSAPLVLTQSSIVDGPIAFPNVTYTRQGTPWRATGIWFVIPAKRRGRPRGLR